MIRFDSDYIEGCHERVLDALVKTNMEQHAGYGEDVHCQRAAQLIKDACQAPDADVHFLVGGTQTNTTVIASVLRPWEGAVCCESGHINCHETGAIESTGHKVMALPQAEGKLEAETLDKNLAAWIGDVNYEHIVQPGIVYISQPTEYGTMYSKKELEDIYSVCKKHGLPLFIDGARLGYALAADETLSLADMARLCDVFYIGGTKVGFLFGEAVVITNPALKANFRNMMKQHGGLLAKGRLLGVQFEAMFEDGLYMEVSRNAITAARKIRAALLEKKIPLLMDSPTNQLFPILTKAQQAALGENFALGMWDLTGGDADALRICTSWATKMENVDALVEAILAL